jgi:hypothetical protein
MAWKGDLAAVWSRAGPEWVAGGKGATTDRLGESAGS